MGFRSTLWFCFVPLYSFLTPGTITGPLVPGIKAVRGRALVAGYIVYIALLCRAMLSPSIGAAEVLPPLALLAVMAPFDFVIAECSRAEHYGYMLFALAFSDSWLFGLQIVQIGLWTGAGVSKLGPWFKYTVVNMSCNSPLAPLMPSFLRALHAGFPTDMRPSRLARAASAFGTCAEICVGPLCAFGPTRYLGVVLALGFHSFIFFHLPFASVQEWNIFCMWAAVYLFGVHEFALPPSGAVHPALATVLLLGLVVVPAVGQLFPARVPFLFAFRPYAGNWFFAWHVVETKALPKLRRLKTAESLLFEENDPTSRLAQLPFLKRRNAYCCDAEYASQFMQYGLPAQLVAFPHYRPLVPIVELLEQRRGWASADAYRLLYSMPFLALVHGWNLAAGWHMREGAPYYPALQATCGFEKGECFAVVFKPTGLLSRTAEWFVVDVADQAVVLRGKAPLSELEAMQPIEMDVDALRRFVVEDDMKKER